MMRAAVGVSGRDFLTFLVRSRLGGFIINMPQTLLQDSKSIFFKKKKVVFYLPYLFTKKQKQRPELGFKLIMSNLKLNCKPEVERKGCCMSSSICLFSAPTPLFFPRLSHLFHPIPADV